MYVYRRNNFEKVSFVYYLRLLQRMAGFTHRHVFTDALFLFRNQVALHWTDRESFVNAAINGKLSPSTMRGDLKPIIRKLRQARYVVTLRAYNPHSNCFITHEPEIDSPVLPLLRTRKLKLLTNSKNLLSGFQLLVKDLMGVD